MLSGFDVLVANPAAPVAPVVRVAQGAMKLAMAVETQLSTTSVEPTTSTSSADPTFSTAPPAIIAAVWTPSTTWEAPSSTWEAPSSTWSPSPSSTWEAPSSTWEAPSSTWTPSSSSAWTPPPSSTPVHAPSSGNKKGVGFNTASLTLGFENSISWTYNWGNQNGQDLTPGVEFYPMMYVSLFSFPLFPKHATDWLFFFFFLLFAGGEPAKDGNGTPLLNLVSHEEAPISSASTSPTSLRKRTSPPRTPSRSGGNTWSRTPVESSSSPPP